MALLTTLGGGMLRAGWIVYRDARAKRQALRGIDLGAVLITAHVRIDKPLRKALSSGDARLLRCNWLVSAEADKLLCTESGIICLKRCQEMPDEAFFSPEEAASLLDRGDRSVLVLSYGWAAVTHPDPTGEQIARLRPILQAMVDWCDASGGRCATWASARLAPPHTRLHALTATGPSPRRGASCATSSVV